MSDDDGDLIEVYLTKFNLIIQRIMNFKFDQ